jgi:hypothetical protein
MLRRRTSRVGLGGRGTWSSEATRYLKRTSLRKPAASPACHLRQGRVRGEARRGVNSSSSRDLGGRGDGSASVRYGWARCAWVGTLCMGWGLRRRASERAACRLCTAALARVRLSSSVDVCNAPSSDATRCCSAATSWSREACTRAASESADDMPPPPPPPAAHTQPYQRLSVERVIWTAWETRALGESRGAVPASRPSEKLATFESAGEGALRARRCEHGA